MRVGRLRETSTSKTVVLEPEHAIGRAHICTLRLEPRYISSQHAFIRHTGEQWELRDLGSCNGTFLDGRRVKAGEECPLRKGSHIAFGDLEADWELVDDSPPAVMVVPLDGGDPVFIDGEIMALPSAEDPRTTLYRSPSGAWILEQVDGAIPLARLQVFESAGRFWRFSCADHMRATTRFPRAPMELLVKNLHLVFAVSPCEEHIELRMSCGSHVVDMGTRTHNYFLLTLARQRLADAQAGVPEASCGWLDQEHLSDALKSTATSLNVDVYRIRKHFAEKGVADAGSIVERRPRQLRIGTGLLAETRQ